MKNIVWSILVLVLCAGCANVWRNYRTGATTPLAQGEVAPAEQAKQMAAPVSSLPVPYANYAGMGLATILGFFLTVKRGARINAGKSPVAEASGTAGMLGQATTFLHDALSGVTEVAPSGSPVGRTVKFGVLGSIATALLFLPPVQSWLAVDTHTALVSQAVVWIGALLAGIQKALDKARTPAVNG